MLHHFIYTSLGFLIKLAINLINLNLGFKMIKLIKLIEFESINLINYVRFNQLSANLYQK